jgi:rubrerythrin
MARKVLFVVDVRYMDGAHPMALNWLDNKGCALAKQRFALRELAPKPISKLDDDAFTRVRVILMHGIETDALRFKHLASRLHGDYRLPMAQLRRVEQHQATLINWLLGPDHSPLDTTIAYEQVAIEVTAALAQNEPDPYVAQTMRFGLLEDFDHLYRFSALMDRLEGKDANNILQCYTDILAGRPTIVEHRAPQDDLRRHYDAAIAAPLTKMHSIIITGAEYQTHDYYMVVGPQFADPVARQLYAEIASIEEQHVTQYGSMIDPSQPVLEQWLLQEASEAYMYYSCAKSEENARVRAIWERFLDYELGHLHAVCDIYRQERRADPEALLPAEFPDALPFASQREFV